MIPMLGKVLHVESSMEGPRLSQAAHLALCLVNSATSQTDQDSKELTTFSLEDENSNNILLKPLHEAQKDQYCVMHRCKDWFKKVKEVL